MMATNPPVARPPVYVAFAGDNKGRGMFAAVPLRKGDVLCQELPLASVQLINNKPWWQICQSCHRLIGTLESQLEHQSTYTRLSGKTSNVNSDSSKYSASSSSSSFGHSCDNSSGYGGEANRGISAGSSAGSSSSMSNNDSSDSSPTTGGGTTDSSARSSTSSTTPAAPRSTESGASGGENSNQSPSSSDHAGSDDAAPERAPTTEKGKIIGDGATAMDTSGASAHAASSLAPLPRIDPSDSFLSPVISCRGNCEYKFCSRDCERACWDSFHAAICPGKGHNRNRKRFAMEISPISPSATASQRKAYEMFLRHSQHNNYHFVLAMNVIAMIVETHKQAVAAVRSLSQSRRGSEEDDDGGSGDSEEVENEGRSSGSNGGSASGSGRREEEREDIISQAHSSGSNIQGHSVRSIGTTTREREPSLEEIISSLGLNEFCRRPWWEIVPLPTSASPIVRQMYRYKVRRTLERSRDLLRKIFSSGGGDAQQKSTSGGKKQEEKYADFITESFYSNLVGLLTMNAICIAPRQNAIKEYLGLENQLRKQEGVEAGAAGKPSSSNAPDGLDSLLAKILQVQTVRKRDEEDEERKADAEEEEQDMRHLEDRRMTRARQEKEEQDERMEREDERVRSEQEVERVQAERGTQGAKKSDSVASNTIANVKAKEGEGEYNNEEDEEEEGSREEDDERDVMRIVNSSPSLDGQGEEEEGLYDDDEEEEGSTSGSSSGASSSEQAMTDDVSSSDTNDSAWSVIERYLAEAPEILGSGIFPTIAAINHSCEPNAEVVFEDSNLARVMALRPIHPNEEITISYIETEGTTLSERRQQLHEYLFVCECPLCSKEGEDEERIAEEKKAYKQQQQMLNQQGGRGVTVIPAASDERGGAELASEGEEVPPEDEDGHKKRSRSPQLMSGSHPGPFSSSNSNGEENEGDQRSSQPSNFAENAAVLSQQVEAMRREETESDREEREDREAHLDPEHGEKRARNRSPSPGTPPPGHLTVLVPPVTTVVVSDEELDGLDGDRDEEM